MMSAVEATPPLPKDTHRQGFRVIVNSEDLRQPTTALVDTGALIARYNVVKREILAEDALARIVPHATLSLINASGTAMTLHGVVDVHGHIKEHPISIRCAVVEHCPHDLILGMAFVDQYQVTLDGPSRTMIWKPLNPDAGRCSARVEPVCLEVDNSIVGVDVAAILGIGEGRKCQEQEKLQVSNAEGIDEPEDWIVSIPERRGTQEQGFKEVLERVHDMNWDNLELGEAERLRSLLLEFADIFVDGPSVMKVEPYTIPLKVEATPVFTKPYRRSPVERQVEAELIEQLQEAGILEAAHTPWGSPNVLVKKKDGTFRLTTNFRRVNQVVEMEQYPIPLIEDLLGDLVGVKFFGKMDLRQGFFQIPLSEKSKKVTGMSTYAGSYQYRVLPMGLNVSPGAFQRCMNEVLQGLLYQGARVYLDDVQVIGRSFDEFLSNLRTILQRFRIYQVRVRLEKSEFASQSMEYVGYEVGVKGLRPSERLVEKVRQWQEQLTTTREIQSFIGLVNYLRRFLKEYTGMVQPLRDILRGLNVNLRKKYKNDPVNEINVQDQWTDQHTEAVRAIKQALTQAPILAHPDPSKPYILETDASDGMLGAALLQKGEDGRLHPIAYESRILSKAERNYSTPEKEALAIIWALRIWRHLVASAQIQAYTDHEAVKWLFGPADYIGRSASRIARWRLLLDQYNVNVQYRPGYQNGLADALSRLPSAEDSMALLRPNMPDQTPPGDYIATVENGEIDDGRQWELPTPEVSEGWFAIVRQAWEEAVETDTQYQTWLRKLPRGVTERNAQHLELWWSDGQRVWVRDRSAQLSHRDRLVLPRDTRLRRAIIRYVHEKSGHGGREATWQRFSGSYHVDRGMRSLALTEVDACDWCQLNKQPAPSPTARAPLHPVPTTYRYELVVIDLLQAGVTSAQGNRYILSMMDHFSRYCILAAIPDKSAKAVAQAWLASWICRMGPPVQVHSDCGTEFVNQWFRELASLLGYQVTTTTGYTPQSNGGIERLNREVIRYLKAFTRDRHDTWDVHLPLAEYAYNTTYHSGIGMSPYRLLFGRDPPDLYTSMPGQPQANNTEAAMVTIPQYDDWSRRQLKLLREYQDVALRQTLMMRTAFKKKFDKRLKWKKQNNPMYQPGDKVLLWIPEPGRPGFSAKLATSWKGPYIVVKTSHEYHAVVKHLKTGRIARVHVNRLRRVAQRESADGVATSVSFVGTEENETSPMGPDPTQGDIAECLSSSYWMISWVSGTRTRTGKTGEREYCIHWYDHIVPPYHWIPESLLPEYVVSDLRHYFALPATHHSTEEAESDLG
jgi:transposase InsO family protein